MTHDVVALVRESPTMRTLADAMVDTGPDLRVREAGGGSLLQLHRGDGAALVSIEAAQRVDVPGEVARLLGSRIAARMPEPCWWVEVRASSTEKAAAELAHRFADSLTARVGGTVWPEREGESQ